MKTNAFALLTLIIISSNISAIAQTTEKKNVDNKETPHEFKNQGEQENYWAEQLFKRNYKIEFYDSYRRQVIVSDDGNYKYGDTILMLLTSNNEIKAILKKRIFYPGIIDASFKYQPMIKVRLPKDSTRSAVKQGILTKKVFPAMTRTDSLSIENFEEVKFLEETSKRKRFRFWLGRKSWGYTTVCFIELTNEKATSTMDMSTFINGTVLTFFKEGWVIF